MDFSHKLNLFLSDPAWQRQIGMEEHQIGTGEHPIGTEEHRIRTEERRIGMEEAWGKKCKFAV